MKFKIEQIALCPANPEKAKELLSEIGLDVWIDDEVVAEGTVFGVKGENAAALSFNYQSGINDKALELEVLHYHSGPNWMEDQPRSVSHLGMHCTEEELEQFKQKCDRLGIGIAQEVLTKSHTNPFLREQKRKYKYVIFDTREILGVDLKFIVRRENAE